MGVEGSKIRPCPPEEPPRKAIKKHANFAKNSPPSAYEDRRWWEHETEGNHVNKRAWANAGWKVENLDVSKKRVKFIRARW